MKILLQAFITRKGDTVRDKHNNATDANLVCYMSQEFADWIVEIREGSDDWLKTNAMFVSMAHDFITFVEAYRSGDSISIELGYQRFVPVWKALGQSRYEERHWRQQEETLLKHPFLRCEEFQRSRASNPYDGSTGKSHLAMDECIELSNRFYTQFPLVKTMEAFARQANYIGMAKMSKRFMNIMMAMKSDNG